MAQRLLPVKPRVVVCGTKFGRIYLSAFRLPEMPFELAGILGQGSPRSRTCAEHYNVPLFNTVDELPDDIDIACVVVGGAVSGGQGVSLAQALLKRGIHVLQEHPLLPAELADCLRMAKQNGVHYRLNTHYVTLEPVQSFIRAAHQLAARGKPAFIDAICSVQVACTLFDILGTVLGGLRPWAFAPPQSLPDEIRALSLSPAPYRNLEGVLAGIPFTLRVQNQLDLDDPDNHSHLLHRITLGGEGGCLTLVDTHGPVIWTPRLHLPKEGKTLPLINMAPVEYLDYPSFSGLTDANAKSHRQILDQTWPNGIRHALDLLTAGIRKGEDTLRYGQYQLVVAEVWQTATQLLGFPDLLRNADHPPLSFDHLMSGSAGHE